MASRQLDASQRIQATADFRRAGSGFDGALVSSSGAALARPGAGTSGASDVLLGSLTIAADRLDIDSARVVRTSTETRSLNVAFHPRLHT